jgi:phage shock protein PspC (stress-responsive transcriptional regulator)
MAFSLSFDSSIDKKEKLIIKTILSKIKKMEKKLQRNQQDKMIAGVCSGLAEYFDIDVTWVRIAFVIAVIASGSGILAYIILWIALPKRPYVPNFGQFNGGYMGDGVSSANTSQTFVNSKKKDKGNLRLIAGVIFIFFGLFFLLNEFDLIPDWIDFENLWPLIIIAMGLYILSAGINKSKTDAVEPDAAKEVVSENETPQADPEINEQINPSTDETTEKTL